MSKSPDLPPVLYYGTFWPDNRKFSEEGLVGRPKIATTEIKDWAWYFARHARWKHKTEAGMIVIYRVNTQRLPGEIIESAIPPEGPSPFLIGLKDWDEELTRDRLLMREWNFDRIPWSAATIDEKILEVVRPDLDLYSVLAHYPSRRLRSSQNH